MESKFLTFVKPLLNYIDAGTFFKKPMSWFYTINAILFIIFPIALLTIGIRNDVFSMPFKFGLTFLLVWFVVVFASWIGFQIVLLRRANLKASIQEDMEFIATPVFSHLIKTIGEASGTYFGIVGFGFSLFGSIFLGDQMDNLSRSMELDPFGNVGFIGVIVFPVLGYFIIVIARFIAEFINAIAAIANNTKK